MADPQSRAEALFHAAGGNVAREPRTPTAQVPPTCVMVELSQLESGLGEHERHRVMGPRMFFARESLQLT